MANKTIHKGKDVYQCDECKFIYKDRKLAEKCESWCKRNKSCNLNITKHAIKIK